LVVFGGTLLESRKARQGPKSAAFGSSFPKGFEKGASTRKEGDLWEPKKGGGLMSGYLLCCKITH